MTPKRPQKKKRSGRGAAEAAATTGDRFGLVQGALLLTFVMLAVAAFMPGQRVWGLNHLAFYPLGVRVVALLLIGVAFAPPVAERIYRLGLAIPRLLAGGGRGASIVMLLTLSLAATFAFIGLRSSTNLLGDGQLIEQSFDAAHEGHQNVVMKDTRTIVTKERIAPGSLLFYYAAAKVSAKQLGKTPGIGIRVFNCLLGGLFVFLFLKLVRDGPFAVELKAWLIFMGLFSCSMQLFFGYMENYTPLLFFSFLYVTSCFMTLHDRLPLWVPIVLFIAMSYSHVQGSLFAPSLIYVVIWRAAPNKREGLIRYSMPAFIGVTMLVALIAGLFTPLSKFYMPIVGNEDGDGVLSPGHLIDIVNEIFILFPVVLGVLAMGLAGRRAAANGGRKTGWFRRPPEWQFVTLALVPCALYLVFFNVEIGMARDWDLFTMSSVALVPLVLLTINRYQGETDLPPGRMARIAAPAWTIVLVTGVAWFGVNASAARSTDRFERILAYDKTHASYAYENLAIFYHDRGDLERAVEIMETATEISRNPRQYVRLAMYYEDTGRLDDAVSLLDDVLGRRPEYGKARFRMLAVLEKREDWPRILEVAREGARVDPKVAVYQFYMGEGLLRAGDIQGALKAFETCLALDPPPVARARIEEVMKTYGRSQSR